MHFINSIDGNIIFYQKLSVAAVCISAGLTQCAALGKLLQ